MVYEGEGISRISSLYLKFNMPEVEITASPSNLLLYQDSRVSKWHHDLEPETWVALIPPSTWSPGPTKSPNLLTLSCKHFLNPATFIFPHSCSTHPVWAMTIASDSKHVALPQSLHPATTGVTSVLNLSMDLPLSVGSSPKSLTRDLQREHYMSWALSTSA
jgi:hypothetical protein